MKEDKLNVIKPGNLATDTSFVEQPKGTIRFALNAVNESNEGDRTNKMNEESNEACYQLPVNTTPLNPRGLYIGDGNKLVFLVSDTGDSLIGIADKECNFNVVFTDANQSTKLGFKVNHQIDALFRLRRGCERTIYWVDPKPRTFIIDKPQNFQDNVTGEWDISKFSLFKKYSKIPNFQDIEVLNTGGALQPGSYNISVQYLDEDLNPTEFTTASQIIHIYNSSFKLSYKDVRGSTSKQNEYQNFGPTDKAIKITLSNLDLSFPFYRLAIIEATNGTGEVNDTKYTAEVSTSNPIFTYTGTNYESIGVQEEVILFNAIIDKADSIEQIENTLILGNVQGKDINLCNLQKYASRITADMVTKRVSLTTLTEGNSKHPTVDIDNTGYMPGEIYSFGIVYIFEHNTLSPTYHIPGKNPLVAPNTVFSYGENVYPMNNVTNISSDSRYTENDNCNNNDYWDKDSEGFILKNTLVRHHRFPLRTDFGLPLVEKVSSTTVSNLFRSIRVFATGSIDVPVICAPKGDPAYHAGCTPTSVAAFQFRVSYNIDGITDYFIDTIDPQTWGGESPTSVTINSISSIITATLLSFIQIEEEGILLTGTTTLGVFTSDPSPKGLVYTVSINESLDEYKDEQYESQIMGIQFSNIQLPTIDDTNGQKIIGYYIVRNERIENEKTILDSAVLGSTLKNKYFISHGHLMPELLNDTRVQKKIVSMINPEFKFNDRKYADFQIIQQGRFKRTEAIHSRQKVNDVLDGSSYDSSKHKHGRSDSDGWTLGIKTRDNVTTFKNVTKLNVDEDRIKEVFYLSALEDRFITDEDNNNVDVFNLACDNKIGIISLKDDINVPVVNSVPYVYLYKAIPNPYSNFRTTPYYKDTNNPNYFGNSTTSQATVFGGDSYISPIRYTNSIFYDNRVRKHEGQTSFWSYVFGGLLVLLAVALVIFTGGVGLIAIGLVGAGATLIASGIKQDAWNRAYNDLYNKGLRETIVDNYVLYDGDCSSISNDDCKGFVKNPEDDEIQWLGETINLWFESTVNMNLRQGSTDPNTPDFLNAPGNRELGTTSAEFDDEFFGSHSIGTSYIPPTTSLDYHMLKKLTYFNIARKQSRAYIGLALAEVYEINPDYLRRNKQKIFNHLGLEYDCCSECSEKFPHRAHYSLQSFQEELSDNFRQFLPNNYRDLEGDTGVITDMFRKGNSLYIHTEEALWHLPQNYQERITGEIVSFIGTGEFFATPPRKIVDDTNSSAGNTHKWGRLKTKYGILFPCHKEKKWYMFDGEKLEPISDNYMTSEFKQRMNFLIEDRYYSSNNFKPYPFSDNPSNIIGTGYISTYDTKKERLLITKKDFDLTDLPSNSDFELCSEYGEPIIFTNMSETIAAQEVLDFQYIGIEDCRMKFIKVTYEETTEIRTVIQTTPINRNIYAFRDISGSFDSTDLDNITNAVQAWYDELVLNGYTGSLTFHNIGNERWLACPNIVASTYGDTGDVLILSFVNEASPTYHNDNFATNMAGAGPTSDYLSDYNQFLTIYPTFDSFRAINYPIFTTGSFTQECKVFIQHVSGAIKGRNFTDDELDNLEYNTAFSTAEWNALKTSLKTNTYNSIVDGVGDKGLEKYNWQFKTNKNDFGTPANEDCEASSDIISPCQFVVDINELLSETVAIPITVTILTPVVEYTYVDGIPLFQEVVEEPINDSWTLSYGLKDKEWLSYHSYLPSFYMYDQEKFYAWKHGLSDIYRFNKANSYQTFFGILYPFIIEYVDVSEPLINKITEAIRFQTQAKVFNTGYEDYIDANVTFNKILVYNSHQISGILNMLPRNEDTQYYVDDRIDNDTTSITISRIEKDWLVNDLRDVSVNTTTPLFIKNLIYFQNRYFIDKIINPTRIDVNKNWMEMESFRDKFLVVRLIFDTFDDTRLIMNFSIQDTENSER